MFNKKRCRLCNKKDLKSNLEVLYDTYSDDYFHLSCMEAVIREPQKFTTSQIDSALYFQEARSEITLRRSQEQESRQRRIKEAQVILHNGDIA